MTRVIVLGAGMIGRLIAEDLAADDSLTVAAADARPEALQRLADRTAGQVETVQADLADTGRLAELIEPHDIAVGALASEIGFQTLRTVIEAGKHYCDICFMPEDALALDDLARERGVAAVVDCGVAPGMSNMLAGAAAATLDPCESIEIYVGGLPRRRRWPHQYKAAFSPHDVIEEYTRPSRIVENGRIVVREALSEPELIDLPHVDTLEAFNTDGLRSLARTLDVPNMKEKTLRYPGHIELMRAMRETGLFSKTPIRVGGVEVRPFDVTSALLFPQWTYEEGEEDLTVMRITATGQRAGREVSLTWDLFDVYDHERGATSMARTTAFPCAIVTRLLAQGRIKQLGVLPPEFLGRDPMTLDAVLEELEKRGVRYQRREAVAG